MLDLRENGLAALNGGRESLVGFSLLFFLKLTCRGYPLCLMGGGVGLLLIRSWVLGNEAYENRNGVLLFLYFRIKYMLYNEKNTG